MSGFTNNVIDRAYENFMKQIPGFHREPAEAKVIQRDIEKERPLYPAAGSGRPGQTAFTDCVDYEDIEFAYELVKKGVRAGELAECIIDSCYQNTLESLPSELLRLGMQVSLEDYGAMHSCLVYNFTEAAAILLERGMDFDACKRWAAEKGWEWPQNDTCTQIETMWAGMQTQSPGPTMQL